MLLLRIIRKDDGLVWYLLDSYANATRVVCNRVSHNDILIENVVNFVGVIITTASNICHRHVCDLEVMRHSNIDQVGPDRNALSSLLGGVKPVQGSHVQYIDLVAEQRSHLLVFEMFPLVDSLWLTNVIVKWNNSADDCHQRCYCRYLDAI